VYKPTKEGILSGYQPTKWGRKWFSRERWMRSRSDFARMSGSGRTKTFKNGSKMVDFDAFLAVFGAKLEAFWVRLGQGPGARD
jgi:hypothetical protein